MRHAYPELYIAQKQADVQREIKQNNLVREAKSDHAQRQGFIANKLHALGIWMIRKGEQLHERYHVRSKACSY
jgi:hypothetical protein